MKPYHFLVFMAAPLIAGGPAFASSRSTHLTAANIDKQHLAFTIDVKDIAQKKEFRIKVKRKAGRLSPVREAHLFVYDGDSHIASCPLSEWQEGGELHYSFEVSRGYLKRSKFAFREYGYVERKDESGRVIEVIPMPSEDVYWFYLEEFDRPKPVIEQERARALNETVDPFQEPETPSVTNWLGNGLSAWIAIGFKLLPCFMAIVVLRP